jgi:hypothetical protein
MERVRGIEPLSTPWQGVIMPLYDTRNCIEYIKKGFSPQGVNPYYIFYFIFAPKVPIKATIPAINTSKILKPNKNIKTPIFVARLFNLRPEDTIDITFLNIKVIILDKS